MIVLIRLYRDTDLRDLVVLHHAVAAAQGSERRVTAAELEEQILAPGFDHSRQLLVAESDGRLVAERDFRAIWTHNEPDPLFESAGVVHPDWRGNGLGEEMIHRIWREGVGSVQALGAERAIAQGRCTEDDAYTRQTYENVGMTLARDNYTMVHADLPRVVPSPPPEGVRIRTYRPGEDDQRWWEAWTEAFGDHWGQMSMTLAYWSWYTRRPTFNPEISLVAATGPKLQEIVGFCHCRIDGRPGAPTGRKSGLLRWVGVRRAWRRKGLGDALTRAGLIALREAGAERVYLGVDHGSWTGADRLYLRNGFTVAQRNLYYRRKMSLAEMAEAGG